MATKKPTAKKASKKTAAKKSSAKSSASGLTKATFVEQIADSFELPKSKAGDLFDFFIETIKKSIKKQGSLSVTGLGTFKVAKRAARMGRNPQTGEAVKVKASKTIRFKPTPGFKSEL